MAMILSKDLAEDSLDLIPKAGDEGLVIYRDGRPVARLMAIPTPPDKPKTAAFLIGALKGKIKINGDIVSSIGHWTPDDDVES